MYFDDKYTIISQALIYKKGSVYSKKYGKCLPIFDNVYIDVLNFVSTMDVI